LSPSDRPAAALSLAPEPDPAPREPTEATRLLCAAVHLDLGPRGLPGTRVRKRLRAGIVHNPVRALGTSPGVDLRPVLAHYHLAARRKLARDLVLVLLGLAVLTLPALSERPLLVAFCLFALACEVVHVEAWIAAYRTVAARMLRGRFDLERESEVRAPRMRALLAEVERAQAGEVTVYSGFTPFVGAGHHAGGWSFVLDLCQGKRVLGSEREPKPFAVADLYAEVREALRSLGLDGLTIEDRLYVDGRRAREDARFVPAPLERPRTSVEASVRDAFVGADGEAVRHYMVVRAVGWGGELVVSTFVRFRRIRGALFVELSAFLLTPLDKDCHAVDKIHPAPGWREMLRLFARSMLATPWLWLTAPVNVTGALAEPLQRWAAGRRARLQVLTDPSFDYGAPASVRDQHKAGAYRHYFQKLDDELYGKVIERRILDSVAAFLDRHDIDTGDLKQRESTILNHGVLMTGGTLKADNLAVGRGARAVQRLAGRAAGARAARAQAGGAMPGGR
jgi:hypothetical protein